MNKKLYLQQYNIGLGSHDHGCGRGPEVIKRLAVLDSLNDAVGEMIWQEAIEAATTEGDLYDILSQACQRLAKQTQNVVEQGNYFLNLGGDQSGSAGTWSGASTAINGDCGLIWLDAHMDSHTPQTSETGNIHGMPLACLLGHGDQRLTSLCHPQAKFKPENVCLIGIRSYEKGEAELLQRLGVRIFFMDEVNERGLSVVMKEALAIVESTKAFGISIDMDAFDPADAPGVGTPAADGIKANDCLTVFKQAKLTQSHLMGLEIVEYNPDHDKDDKTGHLVGQLAQSVFA